MPPPTVAQADNTYSRIESLVRRLTASSSQSALSSNEIAKQVNDFYSSDFPYGIKIDQMRSVYSFLTRPNIDRYPLDVNFDQGVRAPVYIDGYQGSFYKDRQVFFSIWPKLPTIFHPITGDGVDRSPYNFIVPGPFLRGEVTLGGVSTTGTAITITDDGNGNLFLQTPNPIISNPLYTTNPADPGMYNVNTGNPGLYNPVNVGGVNYVTGVFSLNLTPANVIIAAGTQMTLFVSQYTNGRPLSVLFWNNEFTIRPVPKLTHKIEVETFLTPVQFMELNDVPILNQWAKYIAIGAAREILFERQDMAGFANLEQKFHEQESLVLERQSTEELFTPTPTIFNSTSTYANGGWGTSGYGTW